MEGKPRVRKGVDNRIHFQESYKKELSERSVTNVNGNKRVKMSV